MRASDFIREEPRLIWSWFVDPWLRTATPVEIRMDLDDWHDAIMSSTLDAGYIHGAVPSGNTICVWVDDLGSMRQPELATFMLAGTRYWGYALINEGDAGGETVNATFSAEFLVDRLQLQFEEWEARLNLDDYIVEMTRLIENEKWYAKPGKVRRRSPEDL